MYLRAAFRMDLHPCGEERQSCRADLRRTIIFTRMYVPASIYLHVYSHRNHTLEPVSYPIDTAKSTSIDQRSMKSPFKQLTTVGQKLTSIDQRL